MKKTKGIILFVVLIWIYFISFLSLYGLQLAQLTMKLNNQNQQLMQQRLAVQQLLAANAMDWLSKPCQISPIAPKQLARFALSSWERFACSGNLSTIRYYYAIELLAELPCASMIHQNSQRPVTANVYRINLLAQMPKAFELWQRVIVQTRADNRLCEKRIPILPGLQMQRTWPINVKE